MIRPLLTRPLTSDLLGEAVDAPKAYAPFAAVDGLQLPPPRSVRCDPEVNCVTTLP